MVYFARLTRFDGTALLVPLEEIRYIYEPKEIDKQDQRINSVVQLKDGGKLAVTHTIENVHEFIR